MSGTRDYNAEINDTKGQQYAYDFDVDVMHPYKIRSFKPFFRTGSLLELGSHTGAFTELLLPYFDDVTCLDASDAALEEARHRLGDRVNLRPRAPGVRHPAETLRQHRPDPCPGASR